MNSAARMLEIYQRLKRIPTDKTNSTKMMDVWVKVFDLNSQAFGLNPQTHSLEDNIVTCLQAMRSELDLLKIKLLDCYVDENLFQSSLINLKDITSPSRLNSPWNSNLYERVIRAETFIPLTWGEWVLRNDKETEMPEEEMISLCQKLDEIEKELNESDVSDYLRDFIKSQIESIRSALRIYLIQGIRPVEAALTQVVGVFTVDGQEIRNEYSSTSEEGQGVFKKLTSFIKNLSEKADHLNKLHAAGETVLSIASKVGTAIDKFF